MILLLWILGSDQHGCVTQQNSKVSLVVESFWEWDFIEVSIPPTRDKGMTT
jgi:hypothetical protein